MSVRLSLIAALDENNAIGFDNQLPWHLPNDLKRFKALTLNKTILMGRKTAESLGRALPKRRNLVLSRNATLPFAGMESVSSLGAILQLAGSEEIMVIGGGEIYALCLPFAEKMYLTHVHTRLENADAFFPSIDHSQWKIQQCVQHPADVQHAFSFEYIDYIKV